jgi:hypothetical protein
MQKERDRLMKRLREQSRKVSVAADAQLAKDDPHGLLARYAERLQQVTAEKDAAIERYDAQIRDYAERISGLEATLTDQREEAAAAKAAGDADPGKGKRKSARKTSPKRTPE